MSLKPKKKSDLKKIEEKMKVKASKMASMQHLPPYTMIVSEGIKTEPIYIKGLVNKVNEKYKNETRNPHIAVYGTGRNTQGLIRFVDSMINQGKWKHYEKFWLMYDKDDFPLDNFDNTQFEAEARKKPQMAVAWSNESIELWFLLYFEDYRSDHGRIQYIENLNKYFDYSKKREDLYDILNSLGSQEEAKRRARKMYAEFVDADVASMSAMVPATRVFELVEELESYLGK